MDESVEVIWDVETGVTVAVASADVDVSLEGLFFEESSQDRLVDRLRFFMAPILPALLFSCE